MAESDSTFAGLGDDGQSVTASPSDPPVWNTNEAELAGLFSLSAPGPSARPGPSGPITTAIVVPEPSQHDLQNPPPEFYVLLNSIRTGTCSKIERVDAEMLLRWRELVLEEDIIPIRPVNNKVRGHPLPCIFFVRPQEDNKSPASRKKRKPKSPSSRESNEEDDGWDIVHKEPGASGSALNDRGEQPAGRFNEWEGARLISHKSLCL